MMIALHSATFLVPQIASVNIVKINCLYRILPQFICVQCLCVFALEINTYGTGLVIVSLKATLGFPITQGQPYSLSIL